MPVGGVQASITIEPINDLILHDAVIRAQTQAVWACDSLSFTLNTKDRSLRWVKSIRLGRSGELRLAENVWRKVGGGAVVLVMESR
jgi:hypothetical protein